MTDTFGITYEIKNPIQGTIRVKHTGYTSMHSARSRAGHEIKKGFIKSVCVYQREGRDAGKVGLYLVKDNQGHVIKREYNNS